MARKPDHETDIEIPQLPSAAVRTLLTVGLVCYLSVVMLGPLSNPVGSENLTLPLGRQIRPVHEALFLGHGYRFFGPDPGPSHILEYRIPQGASNQEVKARLPDRDQHWPRLLYHRWFMLSETIYTECSTLPEPKDYRQLMTSLAQDIEAYRLQGERPTMNHLVKNRNTRAKNFEISTTRRDELLRTVAGHLLKRHTGESIELYLLERLIPRPFDVQSGVKLNDPRFLSEPRFIGKFTAKDFESPEDVP